MARTTKKNDKKEPETGPVLVQEPPNTVPLDEIEDPEESHEESAESPEPPDARLIPRAGDLPPQDFFAFAAQHPDPSWVDLYVHRLKPAVVNIPPPEWPSGKPFPSYCEKIKGMVTEQTGRIFDYDWLRMVRGSGKYQLRLVDRRLKRTQNRLICQTFLEINEYNEHPPILNDWRELVPCEENKWISDKLLRAKIIKRTPEGGFVAYEEGQEKPQNGTVAPNDPGAILAQTVNLAKDLAQTMRPKDTAPGFTGKDIVDLIGKTQVANDPQKIIDAAKGLIEMSKPGEDKQGNILITLLLAQLEEQRKESAASRVREFELLKDALAKANTPPPAPPAPPDPIETIQKTAALATTLKEAFGSDAAAISRMTGWQEFFKEPLTEFMKGIQPFFALGAQVLAIKAQQSAQQSQQQNGQPRPAAAPTAPAVAQPQQTAPAAPGQPQPQQQPAAQEPQQPMPAPDPVMIILNAALMHVDFTLRDYFAQELSGADFALWFCDTAIPLPAPFNLMQETVIGSEALKKAQTLTVTDPQGTIVPAPEAAKQMILGAYRQNPQVWQKIITSADKEAKFSKFLDEFLAYNPDAAEAAPATPAKGAKH